VHILHQLLCYQVLVMFLVKIALVLGHISVNQRKKVDMLLILDHLLVIVMLEIIFVQV
jgi:hypothetical protein